MLPPPPPYILHRFDFWDVETFLYKKGLQTHSAMNIYLKVKKKIWNNIEKPNNKLAGLESKISAELT